MRAIKGQAMSYYRYGGAFRPRQQRRSPSPSNSLPKLHANKISQLSLPEVKCIEQGLSKSLIVRKAVDKENEAITAENVLIEKANNAANLNRHRYRDDILQPAESAYYALNRDLQMYAVSIVGRLFKDTILYNNVRYVNSKHSLEIIKKHQASFADLQLKKAGLPPEINRRKLTLKSPPAEHGEFKIAGIKMQVSFKNLQKNTLDQIIAKKVAEIAANKEAIRSLKGRAEANDASTRYSARVVRRKLRDTQLLTLPNCPYCDDVMLVDDMHLDHIYPVSKGGRSSQKNLVFVCSACNLQKGTMTINKFVDQTGGDMSAIHRRLSLLEKDY